MSSFEKPIVYIVDGDEILLDSLSKRLSAHDVNVEVYKSAEEFLETKLRLRSSCLIVEVNLAGISKALGDGDAAALGTYFDQSVEVAILEKEDFCDQAQAVEKVRVFFQNNPPKSFNQIHKGSSQSSDSQYCIGDLVTASAKFRVYIYMKNVYMIFVNIYY